MRAVYKKPGEEPEIIEVENELKALQEKVGGYIETVTLPYKACVICNEEGRLLGMPYNCRLYGVSFCGPVLVVGVAGEEFKSLGLTLARAVEAELRRQCHEQTD